MTTGAAGNGVSFVAPSGHPLLVRLMLLGHPDLEQRNPSGQTRLIVAEDPAVIRLLLARHANRNAVDNGR